MHVLFKGQHNVEYQGEQPEKRRQIEYHVNLSFLNNRMLAQNLPDNLNALPARAVRLYSSQKSRMTFSDGFFVIFATTMNAIRESASEGTMGCSPRGLGI